MKSPVTREKYQKRLEKFFDFLKLDGNTIQEKSIVFVDTVRKEEEGWAFNAVLKFMQFQLDRTMRKEITGSTVRNYLKSIKLFYDMADITIAWKKITRGLPKARNYADDRVPTIEEIGKLLEYPDRRLKAIILTMASSGIRLGAWDYLKWGHIRPIIGKEGEILAAKVIVYAEEEEEYFSFISKEAYQYLKEWIDYRSFSGESINDESWVMRDLWDTRVAKDRGLVTEPNKLTSIGIKKLINRAIWAQGLRKKLENGKKRHPFQAIHCYRKWFKTRCETGGMKPINIELLLSHNIGISNSYYRPTENELLQDYLKATNHLTFDKKELLQKELSDFEQKHELESFIMKARLHDQDEENKALRQKYEIDMKLLEEKIEKKFQDLFSRVDIKLLN